MKRKQRGKGEGSRPGTPHQRTDGRWEQWLTFQGKRYKRSGATRQEVRDKITALIAELKNPKPAPELGPTLAELCEATLAKHEDDGGTHRIYTHALKHWRRLLGDDTRKAAITEKAVQSAVDTLAEKLAPGTLDTYFAVLRVALGADHPALKNITLPNDDDEEDTTEPQKMIPATLVARLQAAAQHDPLGICIALGFDTGLRAGEAAGLRWIDIDFDTSVISINGAIKPKRGGWRRGGTKNRKARLVRVSPDVRNKLALHQRIQADTAALMGYPMPEYVLADPATGQRVTRNMPVTVLRRVLAVVCTPEEYARYGMLRFHAIRHSYISMMLSKGVNPADLAARVGHTVQTLLQFYAHAIPGADHQLATLSGELWPVLHSEATLQATLEGEAQQDAAETLVLVKLGQIRSKPHTPAESAEDPDQPPPKIRSKPHEPAVTSNLLSNPLSNPDEVQE